MIASPPALFGFPGVPTGTVRPLMQPEGNGSSGIFLMGEALGGNEEKDRLPFRPYAEAGSVLERALRRAGLPRQSLTISNLVWYRPPRDWLDGAPWEEDAIRACRGLNDALIARVRPKVIVALGGLPMRELTGLAGEKAGITMTRGFVVPALDYRVRWVDDGTLEGRQEREELPGYRIASNGPIPVVGTYHPSFLRRGSKERAETAPKGKTEAAAGGTQGMALLGVLIRDLLLARDIAREGMPKFVPKPHILGAGLEEWRQALESLRLHPDWDVFYDFETIDTLLAADESEVEIVRRDVTQVQINYRERALVSEWFPELLPVLRAIIELPNPKHDWNGRKFDRPILRDMQIRSDVGIWHDDMDYWHHVQPDLPRGLQYATSFAAPAIGPWKHLSHSDPLWYGLLDVLAPEAIWEWLEKTTPLTVHPISNVSLREGYYDQVVRVAPVLDRMSARGIPVDEEKRLALDAEFTATIERIEEECQSLVPDSIKGLSPKAGYVRPPDEVVRVCPSCEGKKKVKVEGARKRAPCEECRGSGKIRRPPEEIPPGLVLRAFETEVKCECWWGKAGKTSEPMPDVPCVACSGTGHRIESVERWARMLPFLPGSWQQVLKYMEFRRDEDVARIYAKAIERGVDPARVGAYASDRSEWKIPRDRQTGRPTTAEAELRRLAKRTSDLLLPKVLEHREVDKARGTYVKGWAPGPDGRVHPNFGFKPATPQLSSDSPNAQNFPAHSELAERMLEMIHSLPGKRMFKFDWKSFFIITGGFEAQDEQFIRIGRVDMHSFFTLVGLLRLERPEVAFGWSDGELKERLDWWRKQTKEYSDYARKSHPSGMTFSQIRDEIAKRAVFGWENGQGAYSLWYLWQESFKNVAESSHCQAMLRGLFGKVDEWQTRVRQEADHAHQLVTRFGHVRRFWDVYQRKPVADNYQPRGDERVYQGSDGLRWLLKPGDDHEAVVAYLPNADAYGIKRQVLVELGDRGWDERYGLLNDVHDALYFECESERSESLLADVKPLMEQKCKYLVDPVVAPDGLWCGVEAASGTDWAKWEKVG
jgi:uracil-DNA glycosylase family 4